MGEIVPVGREGKCHFARQAIKRVFGPGPSDPHATDDDEGTEGTEEPDTVTLTVVVQRGPGLIRVAHEDEACRSECEYVVPRGTTVELGAEELEDSAFQGWDLEVCDDAPECAFEMTADRAVTAFFREAVQLTLTIDCSGTRPEGGCGTVQIDPGQVVCDDETCLFDWRLGSRLVLTAEPAPEPRAGYFFLGWRGDCEADGTDGDEQGETCEITMDRHQSVTAVFNPTIL
jgi:hypothetical protein